MRPVTLEDRLLKGIARKTAFRGLINNLCSLRRSLLGYLDEQVPGEIPGDYY